jgi:hypothetical protein
VSCGKHTLAATQFCHTCTEAVAFELRYLTTNKAGKKEWRRLPDMSGGHWYPSMIELPPRVSGSRGTCALVLGGEKTANPYAQADHADIACLQMGLVFGGTVYVLMRNDPLLQFKHHAHITPTCSHSNFQPQSPFAHLLRCSSQRTVPNVHWSSHRYPSSTYC